MPEIVVALSSRRGLTLEGNGGFIDTKMDLLSCERSTCDRDKVQSITDFLKFH